MAPRKKRENHTGKIVECSIKFVCIEDTGESLVTYIDGTEVRIHRSMINGLIIEHETPKEPPVGTLLKDREGNLWFRAFRTEGDEWTCPDRDGGYWSDFVAEGGYEIVYTPE